MKLFTAEGKKSSDFTILAVYDVLNSDRVIYLFTALVPFFKLYTLIELCTFLRTMKPLWESRVSPNVVYSLRHLQNDRSSLAVGGIDGILRILDQNTGTVRSGCIMDSRLLSTYQSGVGVVEERIGNRLSDETPIDAIHRRSRPPITSLAVGMNKIVTTHNDKFIRLWKFRN